MQGIHVKGAGSRLTAGGCGFVTGEQDQWRFSLVLWAPVLPQEVGVTEDEGGQSNEKP